MNSLVMWLVRSLNVLFLLVVSPIISIGYWLVLGIKRGVVISGAVSAKAGKTQTATVTYLRPEDDKVVKLVGMMHVADQSFYDQVADLLRREEQLGSAILYEQVGKEPTEKIEGPIAEALNQLLSGLHQVYKYSAEISGRAFQMDALPIQPAWINTDIDRAQLVNKLAKSQLVKLALPYLTDQLKDAFPSASPKCTPLSMMNNDLSMKLSNLVFISFGVLSFFIGKNAVTEVILNERNEIGFRGIMDSLNTKDCAVATWGAAHLPGIGKLLETEGFCVVHIDWNDVADYSRVSFFRLMKYWLTGR